LSLLDRRETVVRRIVARSDWLALTVVLAVGLFLRFYRLTSVPRGVLYDEAFNGLDIIQILGGARPIFLPANYGREALFIYLQAVSVSVFGYADWALRVPAAIVGSLTLATSYLLARWLYGQRVAILTCAWLAVSLWHVMYSRIGLRTIMVPLVCSTAFYCVWRGIDRIQQQTSSAGGPSPRSGRWSGLAWFAAGGFTLGVAQYTYPTAHFAPFVLVALAGVIAMTNATLLRQILPGFVIAGVVAILVFAPDGQYFLDHPTAFSARPSEVSIFNSKMNNGDLAATLAYTTGRSLGMFFIRGDEEWDRNISEQPIFDPFSSAVAIVGLFILARRIRQPRYAFAVVWLVVMLIPSIISSGNVPVFLRVTGLIPAVFAVPALGADWLLGTVTKRVPRRWSAAPFAIAGVLFLGGATLTYRDYFGYWARVPQVSVNFNEDRWLAIDLARRLTPTATNPVFVGAGDVDEPLQVFALSGTDRSGGISLFNGQTSLMLPAPGTPVTYLFATRDLPPEPVRKRYFTDGGEVVARTLSGDPITRFDLSGSTKEFQPTEPLVARLGGDFSVAGFDVQRDVNGGDDLTVRSYWSVLATEPREVYFFYQFIDEAGNRVSQIDQRALAPGYWPPGTRGITTVHLAIDPKLATGAYSLVSGAYFRQDLTRLPVIDGLGRGAGSQLQLGLVKVHGRATPTPPLLSAMQSSPTTFGDNLVLLGTDVQPTVARPGDKVKATLYWTARGRPTAGYTVFVHLLDAQQRQVANADAPPRAGRYPTTVWDAGEVIADEHDLTIDPSLAPGSYALEVGMYLPESGKRLPIVDAAGNPLGDRIIIPGPRVDGH
jgi:4-amino-4-deoxy-L-arabinose transferase-like glycosyltransferase